MDHIIPKDLPADQQYWLYIAKEAVTWQGVKILEGDEILVGDNLVRKIPSAFVSDREFRNSDRKV